MNRRQNNLTAPAKSPRKSNIPCLSSKTITTKRNFGVQCDFSSISVEDLNSGNYLWEEYKKVYCRCIDFVNGYHGFLNGELESQKEVLFKIPEVQNYVFLVEYLKKSLEKKQGLKNVVEKLSNTSIIEFVPEIKQLREYKELSNKQNFDSGFSSKESCADVEDFGYLKSQKIPDMFIHPNLENRLVISEIIKEEISSILTKKLKKNVGKLSKTVFNQVDIPGIIKTDCEPQLDFFRQSLMDDDNSTILDDEEFEKMTKCNLVTKNVSFGNHRCEELLLNKKSSHPLKLNSRDMPLVNKDVLTAIGIFTEKGDLRPEIMERIEKGKDQNLNNSKNMKFRERRNLEITKRRTISVESLSFTSNQSDSSDIRSDSETDLVTEYQRKHNR